LPLIAGSNIQQQIHNLWDSGLLIFQHRRIEHSDECRISSFIINLLRDFLI
jgi:hypothetical protein